MKIGAPGAEYYVSFGTFGLNGSAMPFDFFDSSMILRGRSFGSAMSLASEQIMPNTWLFA